MGSETSTGINSSVFCSSPKPWDVSSTGFCPCPCPIRSRLTGVSYSFKPLLPAPIRGVFCSYLLVGLLHALPVVLRYLTPHELLACKVGSASLSLRVGHRSGHRQLVQLWLKLDIIPQRTTTGTNFTLSKYLLLICLLLSNSWPTDHLRGTKNTQSCHHLKTYLGNLEQFRRSSLKRNWRAQSELVVLAGRRCA